MKETVKTFVIVVLVLLVVLLSIKTEKCYQKSQEKPETVYLTDTIVNVDWDTLFIDHFETVKLPVVDTLVYYITDTVVRLDSIEVEVPISKFQFDTTVFTDTTQLNLSIRTSGYDVKLDSLSYSFTYKPTHQKSNFFKDHFRFGLGAGLGYGCFTRKPDVFLGVGFYYCF